MRWFIAIFVGILAAGLAAGEEAPLGQEEYDQYCASCHGVSAKGDGTGTGSILKQPPNLTVLSGKYGMPLPRAELIEIIDGTQPTHARGTREMPVWGKKLFGGLPSADRSARIRGTLLVILDYIESLNEAAGQPDRGTSSLRAATPDPAGVCLTTWSAALSRPVQGSRFRAI